MQATSQLYGTKEKESHLLLLVDAGKENKRNCANRCTCKCTAHCTCMYVCAFVKKARPQAQRVYRHDAVATRLRGGGGRAATFEEFSRVRCAHGQLSSVQAAVGIACERCFTALSRVRRGNGVCMYIISQSSNIAKSLTTRSQQTSARSLLMHIISIYLCSGKFS